MTDETTILLEVLSIQLHESQCRATGVNVHQSWSSLDDYNKKFYRDAALGWFEMNRTKENPSFPIDACTNCGATFGTDNVCPSCGAIRIKP